MNEKVIELNNTLEKARLYNNLLKIDVALLSIKKILLEAKYEYRTFHNNRTLIEIIHNKLKYNNIIEKINIAKQSIQFIFINYFNEELREYSYNQFENLYDEFDNFLDNDFDYALENVINRLEGCYDYITIGDIEKLLQENKQFLGLIFEVLCKIKFYINIVGEVLL